MKPIAALKEARDRARRELHLVLAAEKTTGEIGHTSLHADAHIHDGRSAAHGPLWAVPACS
jgi:hypothetical protein